MAKAAVVNQEVIEARAKIDSRVEEVKQIDANLAEFEALYKARLSELEEQYQSKTMTLKANRERLMGEISGYFDLAEAKETKTQFKLSLLAGDVVRKKSTLKFEPNKEMLLSWAKENDPELVKVTTKEDIDWDTFKTRLVMQQDLEGNTVALDTETGEFITGVEVVEVAERIEVK